jgi:DnaJ-class molecular chaperone
MAHPLHEYFYLSQIAVGMIFLIIGWFFFRPKSPESNFKIREADLQKQKKSGHTTPTQDLAQAKIKRQEPLQLSGIKIDGLPHEILGVRADATPEQIQKTYRELMKRYHPDRVGRQGSREWNDAQKIAEAINRAKEAMLKKY